MSSNPLQKQTKINQAILSWPKGAVQTSSFLNGKEFSRSLLNFYTKSGWLELFEHSAYILKNDNIEWTGVVYGLQQNGVPLIHPGGKTSLFLQGYAHFISSELKTVYLFAPERAKLPLWVIKHKWNLSFEFYPTSLFTAENNAGLTEYSTGAFSIKISSPERAAMEMLHLLPFKQSFEEALQIMENLTTLRPKILQPLLENCSSVKVKRLFLYMAEYHKHPWFKKLDLSSVDLGKGKREIVKNGTLDSKYLITVARQ